MSDDRHVLTNYRVISTPDGGWYYEWQYADDPDNWVKDDGTKVPADDGTTSAAGGGGGPAPAPSVIDNPTSVAMIDPNAPVLNKPDPNSPNLTHPAPPGTVSPATPAIANNVAIVKQAVQSLLNDTAPPPFAPPDQDDPNE